jgi:hypothetical protein
LERFFLCPVLKILLAYNSCTGRTLWYLHMCLQYILVRFTPSIALPIFRTIWQVSFFYFHIWLQNTSTMFTFIHPFFMHTPPIGICSQKRPIVPSSPSFFKVNVDSPREFCPVTLGLYTSCFNQINPPVTYSFSITLLPYYSTAYNVVHYIKFLYRWVVWIFFILWHYLSLFCLL